VTSPSRAQRVAGIVGLVVLVLAAGVSVFVQTWDARRMPSADVARAANAVIADGFRDGDVVRAEPWWFDDARLGLPGVPFLMSRDIDPWDLPLHTRLWITAPRTHDDEADRAIAAIEAPETAYDERGWRVVVGPVATDDVVHADAWRDLDDAVVTRVGANGRERRCDTWLQSAWHCGRFDQYLYVGRADRELDDSYQRCVSANALPDGDRWRIEWADVPLGEQLRLRAANTMWAVRHTRGAPVHFRLSLDGTIVAERAFEIDELPEHEVTFDTAGRTGSVGDVQVEIHTEDHLDRYFCFRWQTVSPR